MQPNFLVSPHDRHKGSRLIEACVVDVGLCLCHLAAVVAYDLGTAVGQSERIPTVIVRDKHEIRSRVGQFHVVMVLHVCGTWQAALLHD